MSEQKQQKGQPAKAVKEAARIEDRKVLMSPDADIASGLKFFLASEQERIANAKLTDQEKFARDFTPAIIDQMQKVFCVSGSTEDVMEFAFKFWCAGQAAK